METPFLSFFIFFLFFMLDGIYSYLELCLQVIFEAFKELVAVHEAYRMLVAAHEAYRMLVEAESR